MRQWAGSSGFDPALKAQSATAHLKATVANFFACSRTSGGQDSDIASNRSGFPTNKARAASSKPVSFPAMADMK
jgi:hypothetical protein